MFSVRVRELKMVERIEEGTNVICEPCNRKKNLTRTRETSFPRKAFRVRSNCGSGEDRLEHRLPVGLTRSAATAISTVLLRDRITGQCYACVGAGSFIYRGSVLAGCNLQMLGPAGFIDAPLPSHYNPLPSVIFSFALHPFSRRPAPPRLPAPRTTRLLGLVTFSPSNRSALGITPLVIIVNWPTLDWNT